MNSSLGYSFLTDPKPKKVYVRDCPYCGSDRSDGMIDAPGFSRTCNQCKREFRTKLVETSEQQK
jgi:hypothetical protein